MSVLILVNMTDWGGSAWDLLPIHQLNFLPVLIGLLFLSVGIPPFLLGELWQM